MKFIKIFFLLLIAFFLIYKIILFFKIDSCLDKGGAWNYPKNICNTDSNSSLNEIQCLSQRGNYNIDTQICEY